MKQINNNELNIKDVEKRVTVYGWVQNKRRFGKKTFIDLRDRSGLVQIVFDNLDLNITKESVLEVTGIVLKRIEPNLLISSGEIEIIAQDFKVLSQASELPFTIRDDNNVNEDLRLQYRYLDLRRPRMQNNIILRSKIISKMRHYLDSKDFIEIETPILGKSTPEGARDYLVATRNHGKFFALPQSPQLFKQMLMASGFERYYQVAKVFRDEDSRKDRQPEFTQFDIETSFMKLENFQSHIEKMMYETFKVINVNLKLPFRRMSYKHAMENYGNDKPDLRYGYTIDDVKDCFKDSDFTIIKSAHSIKSLTIPSQISNKEFKVLEEIAKKNKANILWYITYENEVIIKSNFSTKDEQSSIKLVEKSTKKGLSKGTIFVVANEYESTLLALGAVRVECNNLFKYASNTFEFTWIEDWPMFEYDDDTKRYIAKHHPFTNFQGNNIEKLNIENAKSNAYDLVLNGFEIAGGSERIFNKQTQEKMFELIKLTKQEIDNKFGFFMNVFDYGLPPHLGIAFGIDRLIMIMVNANSIRDVIAFPKNAGGFDLLSQSPSDVSNEQLDEVHISLKDKNERG